MKQKSPGIKPFAEFWSAVGDHVEIYGSKNEAISHAIASYREHKHDFDIIPQEVWLQKWKRLSLPEHVNDNVLRNLLYSLDQNYQREEYMFMVPTERMREAERLFLEVVREDYKVTKFEKVGSIHRVDYEKIKSIAMSFVEKKPVE